MKLKPKIMLGTVAVMTILVASIGREGAVCEHLQSADLYSCLDTALWNEDIDSVKYLIEQGVDPTTGLTISARKYKNIDLVKCFVEYGADVDMGLSAAVGTEDADMSIIEYLIANGADVNGGLFDAIVRGGNIDLVKWFVEHGADANSGLVWAASQNNMDFVKYFLEYGVDVNAKDKHGKTALDVCAKNSDMVQYLLSYGA